MKLTLRDKLFLWSVAKHTPDDRDVDNVALQAACERLNFPMERMIWLLKHHPDEWNRQMAKRDARIAGVPRTRLQQAQAQAAHLTNLKTQHPRLAAKLRRKGVPI